jgi:hypothetical protein
MANNEAISQSVTTREREKYFRPLVSVSDRMHQVRPDKKQAVFQLAISLCRDAHLLCWSMNALGVHLELMVCSSYGSSTLHCLFLIETLFVVCTTENTAEL